MRGLIFIAVATVWLDIASARAADGVKLSEDNANFTLSNEHLTAKIRKRSGDLVSLRYKDHELLEGGSGHAFAYWSHAGPAARNQTSITIDPAKNDGERAEVSCKFFCEGKPLGQGPGGSVIADVEIRYALARDDSAIYTYSIFDHKQEYPATSLGEARFGAKLNPNVFDWMTIDAKRNKQMPAPADWDQGTPLNMKEARRLNTGIYKGQVEHKYDYSAIQFDIPAFGWCGTKSHVGLWFINPTIEYLSGGATKVELTGHLDNNAGAAPTLLNYWRGSHYGGSQCNVAQGEAWTKVVGPFLIYCNAQETPDQMWNDALARAKSEAKAWPFEWVTGVDYPHKDQRGTVSGQLVLNDAQAPDARMSNLLVGLAWPDYPGRRGVVDWQQDAKHYQFWVRGDEQGRFTISNVRPGTYTLHAIADGVLGEYALTNVTVETGKSLDLRKLEWKPQRFGRQLWEIGVPNRSAEEFRHGDHYWQWGLYNEYPKEFLDDVDFVIGKSDCRTDWNYCQCPRADRPNGTTWSVRFDLKEPPKGKATLRLALAATSARNISLLVNDQPAGDTGALPYTATINRDGIRGYWQERPITFDAALLKPGTNVLKLRIPPGGVMNGVEYDYLRLELDESAKNP